MLLRSTAAPLRRRSEKAASAPSLSTHDPGRQALAEIMAMFVIVRRRGKCVYVCIQAEWHPGNEQVGGGGQQPSQILMPPTDTIHSTAYLQRQQAQQLFVRWPDRPAPPLQHQRRRLSRYS